MAISRINSRAILDGSVVAAEVADGAITPAKLQTGVDFTVNGLTVGKGSGSDSRNTVAGYLAVNGSNTGYGLVALGYQSLKANTSGNYNIAIGYNPLLLNTTGSANIAIGNGSLGANLVGIRNTAVGDSTLSANTVDYNTAVGFGTLNANTTGANNTAIGSWALLSNTTASNNTAVGYQAGYSNTTGAELTVFGNNAGNANTTGGQNTAMGSGALRYNTTGSSNTAIGQTALLNNTTGSNNTAVGYQAGYSQTALSANNGNTFIGHQAGYSVTTGNGNTFIGPANGATSSPAGYNVTTGSFNTIIGGYTGNTGGLDIRTASNYIVLSDGAGNPRGYFNTNGQFIVRNSVSSNNALELGNTNTTTGASYGVKFAGGTNSSDYCISGDNAAGTVNLFNFRGNGNFQFNSGFGSAATAYGCRAWVMFGGSNGAISAAGNISYVTRNGTGDYTLGFSSGMPDGAYTINACLKPTSGQTGNNARAVHVAYDTYPSTSSFRVRAVTAGAGYEDPEYIFITVHR